MRPRVILVFAALSTLSVTVDAAAQDRRVERWLQQADREIARGRTHRALPLLRRVMQRAPGDPRGVLRLAELTLPIEPVEVTWEPAAEVRASATEVIAGIDRALAGVEGAAPIAAAVRAQLEALKIWAGAVAGDHRAAIDATVRAAGRLDERSMRALRRLAVLAVRRGDLGAADLAIGEARRAWPDDVGLIGEQGAIRLARGQVAQAIEIFREAVQRAPEDLEARRDLAGALLQAGDARAAIDLFARVAQVRPDDWSAHLDLARAALEGGDASRALAAADEALRRAPRDEPEPSLILGEALAALGRRQQAMAAYREALRRAPGHPRATEALRALEARAP